MTARRADKAASEVRAEAVRYARSWAAERASCGDPEGAECFRMLAREIADIKIAAAGKRR